MSRLLLVRHGITEFNSTRRLAGYSDVEMSSDGYEQVKRLRDRLVNEQIDVIYSSDLKRALVTAEVISSERKVDIVACPELREMNYGQAEGLTLQEIGRLYPEVSELISNFSLQLKFPGGESFVEFVERTAKFVDRLEKHTPSETVLIVSHSGQIRVLVCRLLGTSLERWRQIGCANASLSIVERYPQRAIISLLNDTSHLSEAG